MRRGLAAALVLAIGCGGSSAPAPGPQPTIGEAPAAELPYAERRAGGSDAEIEVAIERGSSFGAIAALLEELGVIDDAGEFEHYATERGVVTRVRAGNYRMRGDLTPREVLDQLLAGSADPQVRVTLPEGEHMLEMFARLEAAGVAPAAELEVLARDAEFLAARGIAGETVDGYLAPDTYDFVPATAPRKVLEVLIDQHDEVWTQVIDAHHDEYVALRDRLGWTDRDILTMASIVEKEAALADEQPRIAQVFLNRLTDPAFKPHRLETDPTIRYGCQVPAKRSQACLDWDPADRLHRAQLDDRDNPYNTYRHEGLPPGPIGNPGRKAIEAVLVPDGSDYLYFVARDDRSHVFARTLREHEKNVDKYIRGQ